MSIKDKFKRKAKQPSYRKMFVYVIIVNHGLGDSMVEILQEYDSNLQASIVGRGTASKEILRMIGLQDERKDIVLAFVDEGNIQWISKKLDKEFLASRRFMGLGFTIPVSSVVGKKVYHFLTNTI